MVSFVTGARFQGSMCKTREEAAESAASVALLQMVSQSPRRDCTVITLNIGTPRPATVVVLNIKQFNFTLK